MKQEEKSYQTIEKVVKAAEQLFTEKGYEQTSIQDMMTLSGVSKGGLYHHFKSKEDILMTVLEHQKKQLEYKIQTILNQVNDQDPQKRLEKVLIELLHMQKTNPINQWISNENKNYPFLLNMIESTVDINANLLQGIIEDIGRDGGLDISEVDLFSEMMMILLNVWVSPIVFQRSLEESARRLCYTGKVFKAMGFDILSPIFIEETIKQLKGDRK